MEYPVYKYKLTQLPYMKNGKIDYRALEKEAENYKEGK